MSDKKLDRRNFFKVVGAAGIAAGAGAMVPKVVPLAKAGKKEKDRLDYEVRPGELDDYYGFWSGGHSGEIREGLRPSRSCLVGEKVGNRDRREDTDQ